MFPKHLPTYGVLIAILALAGCSDEEDPATNLVGAPTPAQPADLEAFFAALPPWEEFSPPLTDADEADGPAIAEDSTTQIDGQAYQCSTTPHSLTTTPNEIVTLNPDVEVLWLGSLLQGRGHVLGIGALGELPIRERAPLEITLDLLSAENLGTVEKPTVATVNQKIGQLIETAQEAGHKAGSSIFYTSETAHSLTQAALKMGLSASYMGSTVKTSLSADMSDETRTVTAYFIQRMFTASMVLPEHPESVFSGEFTQDMLEREQREDRMGPNNLPVYVSSIAYGRILMFSFTSRSSESKIKATLNLLYNGGDFGGEMDGELKSVLENAQIRVVTIGGDAEHALQLIRENNLAAFFTSDAPLTSARPISYTVRNLANNVIAHVSETTNYNLEHCVPAEIPITGARYRFTLTKIVAEALPWIDTPAPWNYYLENHNGAELYYTLYMENAEGPKVAAQYESKFIDWYAARIKEGQTHLLVNSDRSPIASFEFDLHFDGRDYVRVFGEIMDWDSDGPADRFPLSRVFRWPHANLPTHDTPGSSTVVTKDEWGNRFRLYISWRKIADLFD